MPRATLPRTASEESSTQGRFIRVSSSPTKEIAGHGLAFFIAPLSYSFSPIPKDSFGGYLGLFSNNTLPPTVDYPNSPKPIIFVEFDNYVDGRWDPRYKHIGINVNTTRSRATVPWEVRSGQILTTRVRYNPSNMILEVLSFYDQFTQYQVSSSVEVNSLSEYVRVGFSASTGDNAVETHELISWTFSSSNP
ncbi:hypothetical protein PIB30_054748 [Stylosanthes scabra]|uniref:Legume lectin domain-containing protein n=1 Tax=Stylosanthes scabra TaxID=79078 RepID=A0ABU6TIM4_9FABA|nr:hypothetical protein [Stylosanthes scabra]